MVIQSLLSTKLTKNPQDKSEMSILFSLTSTHPIGTDILFLS